MGKVDITLNMREMVGSVDFTQPGAAFNSVRTASGFRVYIPASITFRPPQASQNPLLLENLEATFIAQGERGEIEIGTARYTETLTTERRDQQIAFTWDWTIPALAFYERLRSGSAPIFRLAVSGDIHFLFPQGQFHQIPAVASRFRSQGHVGYSREVWTKTLRNLNLRESVLVEIPFPSDPPGGWEPIWQSFLDARNSFDGGGSTGWKNCIASVRHALEEWQKIEKEEQGAGWQRPSSADLQNRSKSQRVDNIRWHLMQLAHFAVHSKADDWTRDDAILALSTLSALIAVRNP